MDKNDIHNYVKNGIDENTISKAIIEGWCLVCPNHAIKNENDAVTYEKWDNVTKTKIKVTKKYYELSVKEKEEVISSNKDACLTTSQIRNVFGELRRIQLNGYVKEKTTFLLIKPKLAYAVKRHKKKGLDMFYKLFCDAYDAIDFSDDNKGEIHFKNLMNLMEAVLAYHKYHGGRE